MDIVVGTAGHIDHGKTALVKALTGVDTDRLPEEKQRGITIDLGFAELDLDGVHVGFVDVPGHERFVKNMLAGASGIDLVMLVVAADEGVMPQTREHFDICRLLDINAGLIALTKADLADSETLDLVRIEVAELVEGTFLENAPVIPVSSKTRIGVEELKQILVDVARLMPVRENDKVTRMPVDRVFTVKGFGAVVTGTIMDDSIAEGDELDLLPDRRLVRVRGLQTHGRSVSTARAGQRTAVNLGGIDHAEISRGMSLAAKGRLETTQAFDAMVEVVRDAKRPLRTRHRVRVHIGTAEVLARVQVLNDEGEIGAGGRDLVQLRMEAAIVAAAGDRFVVRSYSPQATIAGGKILDPFAPRHRRRDFEVVWKYLTSLNELKDDKSKLVAAVVENAGANGTSFKWLQAFTAYRQIVLEAILKDLADRKIIVRSDDVFLSTRFFDDMKGKTVEAIKSHHGREPLSKGISREELQNAVFRRSRPEIMRMAIAELQAEKQIAAAADTIALVNRQKQLGPDEERYIANLNRLLAEAGLEVPKSDEAMIAALRGTQLGREQARKLLQISLDSGDVLKVSDEFLFARHVIDDLVAKLRGFAETTDDRLVDVPKFKEIAGVSRKFAIPLLEYLDREKITIRSGDKRIIR